MLSVMCQLLVMIAILFCYWYYSQSIGVFRTWFCYGWGCLHLISLPHLHWGFCFAIVIHINHIDCRMTLCLPSIFPLLSFLQCIFERMAGRCLFSECKCLSWCFCGYILLLSDAFAVVIGMLLTDMVFVHLSLFTDHTHSCEDLCHKYFSTLIFSSTLTLFYSVSHW